MIVPPVYNWSGFYVGANVGGAWDNGTTTNTALSGTFVSSGAAKNSGVIGGGQIGYNYMLSPNFLIGIEADLEGTSLNGSVLSTDGSNQHATKLDEFGTVRGRTGITANNWLFYSTGGYAWSEGSVTSHPARRGDISAAISSTGRHRRNRVEYPKRLGSGRRRGMGNYARLDCES